MLNDKDVTMIILIVLFLWSMASTITAQTLPKTIDQLLDAMRKVESDGDDNKAGDGGKAIGPLQIHRDYWVDAQLPDGKYEDCYKYDYAKRVVMAYWQRHASFALRHSDLKTLARVHNGGPDGARKDSTLEYWHKVEVVLNNQ